MVGHAALPHSLEHQPELFLHLTLVWIVFQFVRNSRSMSEFGIGFIPFGDLRAVLDEFQVEEQDTRLYYLQLLQALDHAYVQHLHKLRK